MIAAATTPARAGRGPAGQRGSDGDGRRERAQPRRAASSAVQARQQGVERHPLGEPDAEDRVAPRLAVVVQAPGLLTRVDAALAHEQRAPQHAGQHEQPDQRPERQREARRGVARWARRAPA